MLVPFDNILDTKDVMMVNEDQFSMGVMSANWIIEHIGNSGKVLEVRGLPGNSVDRDRHLGFRSVAEAEGNNFEIVEVVGNWAPGDSQKVTADAIAVQLADGRLVMPANHSAHVEGEHPYRSHVVISDDHGETWRLGGLAGERTNEAQVVARRDGRCWCKTSTGARRASRSHGSERGSCRARPSCTWTGRSPSATRSRSRKRAPSPSARVSQARASRGASPAGG